MWNLIEPDRSFTVDFEVPETVDEGSLSIQSPTGIESGLTQVRAPLVWARGETGVGMVYAVADTGVYWQHLALINQYRGWNGVVRIPCFQLVGCDPCGYRWENQFLWIQCCFPVR